MLRAILTGLALLAPAAAATAATTQADDTIAVCVDVNGALLASDCRAQASRLDPRHDICSCPRGVRTEASICPANVKPPPESPAVAHARREILRKQASLVGATFEGRALCVERRQR